jgi:hypothetical protein
LQQFMPRMMLENVPSETIYSQIDRINRLNCREANRLVLATCGPPEDRESSRLDLGEEFEDDDFLSDEEGQVARSHVVVGAVRSAGRVQGTVLQTKVPTSPVPESEPLRRFFLQNVVPYLTQGAASRSPLTSPMQAGALFRDLRTQLDVRAHPTVDALQEVCDQRRQHDFQARLHVWLHNWLLVHLPLSIALVALMFVHIYVAMKYW